MKKGFGSPPPPNTPEVQKGKEGIQELTALFDEAEKAFETGGRELAKPYLPNMYNKLIALNKWDKANWSTMVWNKDGDLTEKEFNELNLRRKKLSNAIGRLMADGTIEHDLNEV